MENIFRLDQLSVHYVGNKHKDESLILSDTPILHEEELFSQLSAFFLKPFKREELFHLFHENSLEFNEVHQIAKAIFSEPEKLHLYARDLATHLYQNCAHPKIKGGEFFVAYFPKASILGEDCAAIGLFKTENKETFFQVENQEHDFNVSVQKGIYFNKLDKACLIYNTQEENGFLTEVVDKTNQNMEALYWVDDFLQVRPCENSYFSTESTMTLYKNFVDERLPEEFDVNKIDQADLLNKSMDFFNENEAFESKLFHQQVLQQPELIESFEAYKLEYESDRNITLQENFGIHPSAVKKQKRVYKSVIKLDKNFHIYVHGDRSKIIKDEDSQGKFYKIYFQEEN
ncbi:37-kD nucleoid-associated bacterial protein [Candidatus Ornithobacterium hominis]|uniref:nucleoid-associated protein n=1 Tax=Candidatus Ornithobacterium hominis TaxID=2497989 RepID=UPI0024BC4A11|nr:nucleoid-associated protein [Candidatus Ornithobacterium hominis]CAI9430132.1 37-kD nucleoid-associated bacterial protein [Candidatus Ornithobacterium hominis]